MKTSSSKTSRMSYGHIICTPVMWFLVAVYLLIQCTLYRTNIYGQTKISVLENVALDWKRFEVMVNKSVSSVLIEEDNGNTYMAFKINSAKDNILGEISKEIKESESVELERESSFSKNVEIPQRNDILESVTQVEARRSTLANAKDVSNVVSSIKVKHEAEGFRVATESNIAHKEQREQKDTNSNHLAEGNNSSTKRSTQYPPKPLSVSENPYLITSQPCDGKLAFLVVVHSAATNFMRRSSLRETWANSKVFKKHSVRPIFVLGMPESDSMQTLIEHEALNFNDIIQGKFVDSYRNLTLKGVLWLRWVSKNCRQAQFIVKVDDDVFLNVFRLMEQVDSTFRNKTRQMWCWKRDNNTSPIQRSEGKWQISENEFKNMNHYPVTYCNGFFVLITRDIITELYDASKVTPFFWVDDVYLFGLLQDKIENVQINDLKGLGINEEEGIKCFSQTDKACDLLVTNAVSDGIMDKLWFSTLKQYQTLAQNYTQDSLFS